MAASGPMSFLDLPRELRDIIYNYVFASTTSPFVLKIGRGPLLRTCQQIRSKAKIPYNGAVAMAIIDYEESLVQFLEGRNPRIGNEIREADPKRYKAARSVRKWFG